MKLTDLRKNLTTAPSVPPPGKIEHDARMMAASIALVDGLHQVANAPKKTINIPTWDFLSRDITTADLIQREMIAKGYSIEHRMDIVSNDDLRAGARIWGATITSPIEGVPNHRQVVSLVRKAGRALDHISLELPAPADSLFRPITSGVASKAVCLLREAVRSYGWPVSTRAYIHNAAQAKHLSKLAMTLFIWDLALKAPVVEMEADYDPLSASEASRMIIPIYPGSRLVIKHSELEDLAR